MVLNAKEEKIAKKILGLITQKIPMNKESPTGGSKGKGDSDDSGSSTSGSRYDI